MDWLALLLKLAHVVLAIAMAAGLVGRWILLTRAAASDDVERAHILAEAASRPGFGRPGPIRPWRWPGAMSSSPS